MKKRFMVVVGLLAAWVLTLIVFTSCGQIQKTSTPYQPKWTMAATPAGTFLINMETGEVALYANLVLINTPRAQLPNDVYQQLLVSLFANAAQTGTTTPGAGTTTPGRSNGGASKAP